MKTILFWLKFVPQGSIGNKSSLVQWHDDDEVTTVITWTNDDHFTDA